MQVSLVTVRSPNFGPRVTDPQIRRHNAAKLKNALLKKWPANNECSLCTYIFKYFCVSSNVDK